MYLFKRLATEQQKTYENDQSTLLKVCNNLNHHRSSTSQTSYTHIHCLSLRILMLNLSCARMQILSPQNRCCFIAGIAIPTRNWIDCSTMSNRCTIFNEWRHLATKKLTTNRYMFLKEKEVMWIYVTERKLIACCTKNCSRFNIELLSSVFEWLDQLLRLAALTLWRLGVWCVQFLSLVRSVQPPLQTHSNCI